MQLDWPILSVLVWLPIAAGVLLLLVGDRNAAVARWLALAASVATFVVSLLLWREFDTDHRGDAVRRAAAVDRRLQRLVPPRRRRHLDAADRADRVHHAAGRDRRLDRDREAPGAVLRGVPDPRRPDDRRVRRARRAAVLRVLGSDADPDVRDHRRLGRAAARLRDGQVLPVHVPGLGVHAGRADLHVPAGRQLRDRRPAGAAADAARAGADLPRVPARLRGQGADVAGAHLAAGRARRGADRRLGDPGGDHAEDGRLRLPALQPADHAGRGARARLAGDHAVADRRGLHRLRRAGAAGHEEADRVFVDRAHGLRHAGRVRRVRDLPQHRRAARRGDGPRRRDGADDLARPRLRRAVPLRRRAVRPHAQPRRSRTTAA